MTAKSTSPSKIRIVLLWALILGVILFWAVFYVWRASNRAAMPEQHGIVFSIVMLIFGGLALAGGVAGYFVAIFTQCLTFDFSRPIWHSVRVKKYAANIIFPTMAMIGLGLIAAAFVTPLLGNYALPGNMAFMLPFFGIFCVSQVALIWVLIWMPLETRVIRKRLAALGISSDQMVGGLYIGLSNPAITSSAKRFYSIEEDLGMLWFVPGQMIYWGDSEQFSINAADLLEVERKADTKSTSMLSGTSHVILHVRLSDNTQRQIRLHTKGIWTMGGIRRASDDLAARIHTWLSPVAAQG